MDIINKQPNFDLYRIIQANKFCTTFSTFTIQKNTFNGIITYLNSPENINKLHLDLTDRDFLHSFLDKKNYIEQANLYKNEEGLKYYNYDKLNQLVINLKNDKNKKIINDKHFSIDINYITDELNNTKLKARGLYILKDTTIILPKLINNNWDYFYDIIKKQLILMIV